MGFKKTNHANTRKNLKGEREVLFRYTLLLMDWGSYSSIMFCICYTMKRCIEIYIHMYSFYKVGVVYIEIVTLVIVVLVMICTVLLAFCCRFLCLFSLTSLYGTLLEV